MNRTLWLTVAFVLGVIGIGLVSVGIATDFWFTTRDLAGQNRTLNVYSLGLWRKCYKTDAKDRSCQMIPLIKHAEHRLPFSEQVNLHLNRAAAGLTCACVVIQLFTLLTVVIGWCRCCGCRARHENCTVLTAAFLSFLALISGMAGGTCFIAMREREVLPPSIYGAYDWSFIVMWCGTGTCLLHVIIYTTIATCHHTSLTKSYTLTL